MSHSERRSVAFVAPKDQKDVRNSSRPGEMLERGNVGKQGEDDVLLVFQTNDCERRSKNSKQGRRGSWHPQERPGGLELVSKTYTEQINLVQPKGGENSRGETYAKVAR